MIPTSAFVLTTTAPSLIYTISLHDALPSQLPAHPRRGSASPAGCRSPYGIRPQRQRDVPRRHARPYLGQRAGGIRRSVRRQSSRSEEHTSELQSRENLVCRLLLEKKHNIV